MKYHQRKSKWVVKAFAEKANALPREIIHAPKVHFAVPVETLSRPNALLKSGMISELFKWGSCEVETIVDRALEAPTVMSNLLSVELWARIFLKGISPEHLGEELVRLSSNGTARQRPFSPTTPAASFLQSSEERDRSPGS